MTASGETLDGLGRCPHTAPPIRPRDSRTQHGQAGRAWSGDLVYPAQMSLASRIICLALRPDPRSPSPAGPPTGPGLSPPLLPKGWPCAHSNSSPTRPCHCVCAHMCMYVHMYECMHVLVCVQVHVCAPPCVCACVCVLVYECMCVSVCRYLWMRVCVCMCVDIANLHPCGNIS